MKKKIRLTRACRQCRNARMIMAGVLALCLTAVCAGPAGASTGSVDASTALSPSKHFRSWPGINPVDFIAKAKPKIGSYMCDGATSIGGCISNYYTDFSHGNSYLHQKYGPEVDAFCLLPFTGLACLAMDANRAPQGGSVWTVIEDIPGVLIPGASKALKNMSKIKADSNGVIEGAQAWNDSQKLDNIDDWHAIGSIWAQIIKNASKKQGNSDTPKNQSHPSTPNVRPPGADPTAQATVVKTFEPWVAVGQYGGSAPAPGLVVTNDGTAACDSGSANDPGSAVAVRCSPPGNGMPCYINDTGGGDPGSPLLCSSDPTSKQVIEVTPAGPDGIPAGVLNPGDPSQPPWFLVLADGRKCHFLGYGTNTDGLSYDCGNSVGATVPDRSSPTWTVQEGQLLANPAPSPARVAVVTAYRGKTSFAAPTASSAPAPATPSSSGSAGAAPPPSPSADTTPSTSGGFLFVANSAANSVTEYAVGATGDASPIATIAGPHTGLDHPVGVAVDSSGHLFVTNWDAASVTDSVNEYQQNATGDATPIATIAGPDTGLNGPTGVAVDSSGHLFVANAAPTSLTDSTAYSVNEYQQDAAGDATPIATIAGPHTGLAIPGDLAVDSSGHLLAANEGAFSVTEYQQDAAGDATPVASIAGPQTGLVTPVGVAVDSSGHLFVTSPGADSVNEYQQDATGDASPIATIALHQNVANPGSVAVDSAGHLFVTNPDTDSVSEYEKNATGNATPIATIAGPNTGLSGPAGVVAAG